MIGYLTLYGLVDQMSYSVVVVQIAFTFPFSGVETDDCEECTVVGGAVDILI